MSPEAFRIIIIIGILGSVFLTRANQLAGGIVGTLVTFFILFAGLSAYSAGAGMTIFGLEVSRGLFLVFVAVYFLIDFWSIYGGIRKNQKDRKTLPIAPSNKAPTSCPFCGFDKLTSMDKACPKCLKPFPSTEDSQAQRSLLTSIHKVEFFRDKSLVGALMPQVVLLNGYRVGEVKNGAHIEFSTKEKSNTITVTDHLGVAFPGSYTFEATEGGATAVHFKRKFSSTQDSVKDK